MGHISEYLPICGVGAADDRHCATEPNPAICRLAFAIDGFVERMYRTGFVQSLIVHVALLLLLVLTVIRADCEKPLVMLAMRFDDAADQLLTADEPLALELLAVPDAIEQIAAPDSGIPATPLESTLTVALPEVDVAPGDPGQLPSDIDLLSTVAGTPAAAIAASWTGSGATSATRRGLTHRGAGPGGEGAGGGGIGGEMGRRLRAAGAGTGDVQVSIRWDNSNDIDVHVRVEPFRPGPSSMINFVTRRGICGGILDVDANATPSTVQPVENIFWAAGRAPYGRFTVAVHHFRSWSGQAATPVEVAVLVDGEVRRFEPIVVYGGPPVHVITFDRKPGDQQGPAAPASSSRPAL